MARRTSRLRVEERGDRRGSKSHNFVERMLQRSDGSMKADIFLQVFKYYDRDGNRYLEKEELDAFLKDFLNSSMFGTGGNVTDEEVAALKVTFLQEFDDNRDGKISVGELSAILPVDEGFFALFRLDNVTDNGVDYMKIWKKYDRDLSGYIEKHELKEFLRDLIRNASVDRREHINEERLDQYTQTILELFDINNDGKLGLSELCRMLPDSENFVQLVLDKAIALDRLSQSDVDGLLDKYDKDGNGTLEGSELTRLVHDILAMTQKDGYYNASDVYDLEQALLRGCDIDRDGHINRKELAVILLAIADAGDNVQQVESAAEEFSRRVFQGRKGQHIMSYVPMKETTTTTTTTTTSRSHNK
ncbi:hypothetical protein RvY_12713 [Ramazzottius varieornatus]|uniref:EF-hand domain-containing protein n=1 Tax=Ramazzottius varieornatus TaxID=947166 RepID=A0A1D1VU49_RAMVA|nr:hypothetical protein RvY_12713 [Ramazzottius varieornatus]